MKKQLAAICLLAGTAIGSGMISLPIVLAKCGITASCILFIIFAIITYISSIIRCDLNINSQAKNSLQDVGKLWGGNLMAFLSDITIKLLLYSLIAAYIFGLSSMLKTIIDISQIWLNLICVSGICLLLFFPIPILIFVNKYVFIAMMITFIGIVIFLVKELPVCFLPDQKFEHISVLFGTVPVVFTSFGFQGSLHNMTSFVKNDVRAIKRACFWGSFIPVIIYMTWTICILTIVFNTSQDFFNQMLSDSVSVNDLMNILIAATHKKYLQSAFSIITVFAILTSLIGVVLSLFEPFVQKHKNKNIIQRKTIAIIKTMILPTIVASLIPNAFIKVLNFSGILLALIAIIIPCVLRLNLKNPNKNTIIKNKYMIFFTLVLGFLIIGLGF